jgi:hypothetical protein
MSKKIEDKVLRRFRRFVGFIGFVGAPLMVHKLLCIYKPEWARKLYFDKLFKDGSVHKSVINKIVSLVINLEDLNHLLGFYNMLMWFGMIPMANLEEVFKLTDVNFETSFLGVPLKHPIGLAAGIDNLGLVMINIKPFSLLVI